MNWATLCIDAGTTLIKAVVFDSEGRELVIARRPTQLLSPHPGYAEQNMTEVWAAVAAATAEAAAASPLPIGRLALTAQGDGAWLVDRSGAPARSAILWNDGRSVAVLERWRREDVLAEAFALNGSLSNLGLPNAILATLLAEDSTTLTDIGAVLTCGSWLFLGFTGVIGLSPSDASAPWLDIASGEYSAPLLELYGLSALRPLLPPLLVNEAAAQPLLADVAASLGLPAGIPVVLAPYDVVATAAGGGTVEEGAAFSILGTTLCTGVITAKADTSGRPAGLTLRTTSHGPYVRAFPTLAGTGVLDWLAGILGLPDAAAITELAEQSEVGARGVSIWPYLSPAGERAPFLDENARGVIAGLSFEHSRADLARATVEGLAHVIRDCLEAAATRPTELALSGGGSSSDLWCQIIADGTGVPTVRSTDAQIGAKGALVYAAVATGEYRTVAEAAAALVVLGSRFEPNPKVRELHNARYRDFLDSRAAFAERWAGWSGWSGWARNGRA